jgi:hypothetical protein
MIDTAHMLDQQGVAHYILRSVNHLQTNGQPLVHKLVHRGCNTGRAGVPGRSRGIVALHQIPDTRPPQDCGPVDYRGEPHATGPEFSSFSQFSPLQK